MLAKKNKRQNSKKKDIIEEIHSNVGLNTNYTSQIVSDIINMLSTNLRLENKLKIKNFGVFSLQQKKERIGRNPKNKDRHVITERIVVKFKVSDVLKKKINKYV
jgi:integration host factor subunit alpha